LFIANNKYLKSYLSGGDWILTPKHSVSHHRGGGEEEKKKKAAVLSHVGLYLGWDL
jgi:hypothetical protein